MPDLVVENITVCAACTRSMQATVGGAGGESVSTAPPAGSRISEATWAEIGPLLQKLIDAHGSLDGAAKWLSEAAAAGDPAATVVERAVSVRINIVTTTVAVMRFTGWSDSDGVMLAESLHALTRRVAARSEVSR